MNKESNIEVETMGGTRVNAEDKAAIFQTCRFGHNFNFANASAGMHCAPSQTRVTVAVPGR